MPKSHGLTISWSNSIKCFNGNSNIQSQYFFHNMKIFCFVPFFSWNNNDRLSIFSQWNWSANQAKYQQLGIYLYLDLLHQKFPSHFKRLLFLILFLPRSILLCMSFTDMNGSHISWALDVCLSVTKFFQDWIISFFWYCTWW